MIAACYVFKGKGMVSEGLSKVQSRRLLGKQWILECIKKTGAHSAPCDVMAGQLSPFTFFAAAADHSVTTHS